MQKLTRRSIAEILPEIRPQLALMVKTNDIAGFKRLLGNYGEYLDRGEKEKAIAMFEQLAKAWFESQKKASR